MKKKQCLLQGGTIYSTARDFHNLSKLMRSIVEKKSFEASHIDEDNENTSKSILRLLTQKQVKYIFFLSVTQCYTYALYITDKATRSNCVFSERGTENPFPQALRKAERASCDQVV